MLSDEQLNKNTSLEDKKDMIWQQQKKELGVKLIFFMNCREFFCFVWLVITIPDLSLFEERTCNVTAQLNLISNSDVWTHPPITTARKSPSQVESSDDATYWFYDADFHLIDLI